MEEEIAAAKQAFAEHEEKKTKKDEEEADVSWKATLEWFEGEHKQQVDGYETIHKNADSYQEGTEDWYVFRKNPRAYNGGNLSGLNKNIETAKKAHTNPKYQKKMPELKKEAERLLKALAEKVENSKKGFAQWTKDQAQLQKLKGETTAAKAKQQAEEKELKDRLNLYPKWQKKLLGDSKEWFTSFFAHLKVENGDELLPLRTLYGIIDIMPRSVNAPAARNSLINKLSHRLLKELEEKVRIASNDVTLTAKTGQESVWSNPVNRNHSDYLNCLQPLVDILHPPKPQPPVYEIDDDGKETAEFTAAKAKLDQWAKLKKVRNEQPAINSEEVVASKRYV
jgi:hypothetical protein